MFSPKTLHRLAAAQAEARGSNMQGTADRLQVLHRELSAFKSAEPRIRERKMAWALAKLEDTRKTLSREGKEAAKELEESRIEQFAGLIKRGIFLGLTMWAMGAVHRIGREGGGFPEIAQLFIGVGVFGSLACMLADRILCGIRPEHAARKIAGLIDECARMIRERAGSSEHG